MMEMDFAGLNGYIIIAIYDDIILCEIVVTHGRRGL